MANEVFVDTSGFFAAMASRDRHHRVAAENFRKKQRSGVGFVTTDYVLDETATLLVARGLARVLPEFFRFVLASKACRIHWTDSTAFQRTAAFRIKHLDKEWSFTDCLSFQIMRDLGLRRALTSDIHFEAAGFERLLK